MHYIEPLSLKFILLHSEGKKSKWYNYFLEELKQRGNTYFEIESIPEAIALYEEDEENTFIFLDLLNSFSSFDIQALRGKKMYGVNSCKFELQKTKERIVGQKIKEFSVTGSSVGKCFFLCSFISDFDPFATLSSNSAGHLVGRLQNSEAFAHFELVDENTALSNVGFRYCVSTESENLCFMVLNDLPFQSAIKEEIKLFILDQLNLRSPQVALKFFEWYQYVKILAEIGEIALSERKSFSLKPPFYLTNQSIINQELNKQMVGFCTTGSAVINREALFEPLFKLQNSTLASFYTTNKDKALLLYSQTKHFAPGYYSSFENLVNKFRGVAYVPSLPGERKSNEILSFIKTSSENFVLAEKPGFANFQSAQNFLEKEQQINVSQGYENPRTLFGWHYVHHPAIQDVVRRIQERKEFGEIAKINAFFTRPKPFSTSGRIFDPNQGGCGLDRFCYPLHLALTLSKSEDTHQTFKVVNASHLTYNEIYGKDEPQFEELEGRLEANLILNGSIQVDLMGSMETQEQFFSSAEIIFQSGTVIKIQWFIHPHVAYRDFGLYCCSIKQSSSKSFAPLTINTKFDTSKSSYDYQIEELAKMKQKLSTYNTTKDMLNLCAQSNAYFHEVLDAIFLKSGLSLKKGL